MDSGYSVFYLLNLDGIRPTYQMVIEKVNEACGLLTNEGKKAFPQFKVKNSPFIFAGTYIWIIDMTGVMIMHPVKIDMERQQLIAWKDSNGKGIFAEFIKKARGNGAGWVDYMWPKPGENHPSRKVSYVKLCKVYGEDMVVGCGIYDLPDHLIDQLIQF